MGGSEKRTTLWIAITGGVYWSASVLFLTLWRPMFGAEAQGDATMRVVLWLFISVTIIALLAIYKQFMRPRVQQGLAAVACAATAAYVALPFVASMGGGSAVVVLVLHGLHHALLIVFWGLAYVSLSKKEAERVVAVSLLVAFLVYFLGTLIPIGAWSAPVAAVLRAVGAVPFMLGTMHLSTCERTITADGLAALVPFCLGRVCLGACMAPLFFFAALPVGDLAPNRFVSIGGALVSALLLIASSRQKGLRPSVLRVAPLLILGALFAPYLTSTSALTHAMWVFCGVVSWASWISLSAAQLSDIKEQMGLDETFLAISEKAVVITALFIGYSLCTLAFGRSDQLPVAWSEYWPLFEALPLYLSLTMCCFQFATLVDRKHQQRLISKGLVRAEDQARLARSALAERYSLTEREKDVFELMAAGHTRPRIREQLCMSDGTVKTHAYHIYKKMDVHSREELYALVEAERAKVVDQEGDRLK